ncbi:ankyrin [Hypoxylon sp. EC38]|nr:ankyrin [Hypoxylon sp. EC38]
MALQNKMRPAMPVSERHQTVTDIWEVHRKIIHQQYIVERKKLKDVANYMKEHYQFCKNPRDYEYRLKKWGYMKNVSQAKRKLIQNEIKKRTSQGKASEVLQAGLRLSLERVAPRPQPLTLAGKYLLNTSHSDSEMVVVSGSPQVSYLRVQTPSLFVQKEAWPSVLPWLIFNSKFGALLTAHFRQATKLTLPVYDFQPTRDRTVSPGSSSSEIALFGQSSVRRLKFHLDLLCPETHEGDHMASAEILCTESRESASIEFLKLVVYLLSNNMDYDLYKLTNGKVSDPVSVLYESGLLTKESVAWLKNASDPTSETLIEELLSYSLMKDNGDHMRWMLGERIDTRRFVYTPIEIAKFDREGELQFLHSRSMDQTLLQAATSFGSTSCCEILLEAGADPNLRANNKGHFPLEYAACGRSPDEATRLVDLLLSKGADLGRAVFALLFAAHRGNSSIVERLMQRGAKISPTVIRGAVTHVEMLSLLLDNSDKWIHPTLSCPSISDMIPPSTLRNAIMKMNPDAVKFLLKNGADPNEIVDDQTHIEYLIYGQIQPLGAEDILEPLLKYGGLVNKPPRRHDSSILMAAVCSGSIRMVQMLLDAGADIDFSCPSHWGYRSTALVQALLNFNIEVAKLILEYKPVMRGPELKFALKIGDLSLMDKLFEAGAQLEGDELSSAIELRKPEIVSWLIQKGATIPQASPLEIALCAHNFEGIPDALPHAVYSSRSLFEATSLALKAEQYVSFVSILITKRATTRRDDLEVAALAIAVMNRNLQLCQLLSDPKFLSGGWTATYRWLGHVCASNMRVDIYVEQNDDGIFEVYPFRSETDKGDRAEIHILQLAAGFESRFAVNYAVSDLISLGAYPSDLGQLKSIITDSNLRESELIKVVQACARLNPSLVRQTEEGSLLREAILYRPALVKTLLDLGADANAEPEFENPRSPYHHGSRTPLQCAVERGHTDAMRHLLKAGADVNAPPGCTRGATCLQIAAINGHIGIARMILTHGTNVNAPRARFEGRTAVEGAAENGRLDMVKLLLLRLQDIGEAQEHRIQFIRAIKFATLEGHHVIAKMLRHHIQWNEDDQTTYNLIDTMNGDILDEMTQELSPYELRMLEIQHTTDEVPGYWQDETSDTFDYSSDGGDDRDDTDDSTGKDLNEAELHYEQITNQEVPIGTPTTTGSSNLGLVPVEGYQDLFEETPAQKIWEEELRSIEEFNPQSSRHFPISNTEEWSAGVSEGLSCDVFMGADADNVMDWEGGRFT